MKKIVLIIHLIFVVLLFSCNKEEIISGPPPSWQSKHLICNYLIPDSLELRFYKEPVGFCIVIEFAGNRVFSGDDASEFYPQDPLFDSISSLYNDNSWNRKSDFSGEAVAYTVNGIQILSDKDFDSSYPAGNNLIEKATVSAESWGDFVLWKYPIGQEPLKNVKKAFKDMTKAERSLWYGDRCEVIFPYPEQSGTYNFTITVTFEGGKTLTKTIEAELPSASSVTPPIRSDLDDSMRREGV